MGWTTAALIITAAAAAANTGLAASGAFTPDAPEPLDFALPTSDDEDKAAAEASERERRVRRRQALARTFPGPAGAFVEQTNVGINRLVGQ